MLKKYKYHFALLIIFLLSLVIRTYNLTSTPPSLNPDEAAVGYNAYAILKTGGDEHGKFLPLYMQSFGDWKLPGYSYIDIPFVAAFGLSEFSVRLPSVLAGSLSTILIYFIAVYLFRKKQIGIAASILFALSPWNIYFSRAAYEVNLALLFFLLGIYFYLKYASEKKDIRVLVFSAVFFAVPLFIYHSFILFTPLFIFALFVLYWKKIPQKANIFFGIIMLFSFLFSFYNISHNNSDKISTLSIFNNENVIYNRAEKLRGDGSEDNAFISKGLYNKYFAGSYQFAQNYLSTFSTTFIFDKGGEKTIHNLGYFGNLYIFDALLLSVGLFILIWNREKSLPFILAWLLIAPLPSALTPDAQNSTRLYTMMPALTLISAYGAYYIFSFLFKRNVFKLGALGILLLLFALNIVLFLNGYFVHMNVQRARFWHYGYKEIVMLSEKNPDHNIVFRGPENFPYIYFLFYTSYDPRRFIKEVKYYPLTSEGFRYVKSFGKYQFPAKIDYLNLKEKTIYVDDYINDPGKGAPKEVITLPSGEAIFVYKISD